MKRIISLLMLAFVLIIGVKANDDRPIPVEQLPEPAKELLNKHFTHEKIVMVKQDKDFFDKDYTVIFQNGNKIKFDKKGNWEEIDCEKSIVPTVFIPEQIMNYIKSNYPDQKVTQIEKKKERNRSYEIELDNVMELTFDKNYAVIDIDL